MKIEDVLHLYLGQRVVEDYTGKSPNGILFGVQGDTVKVKTNTVWTFGKGEVKLILRRLSDMSEDEAIAVTRFVIHYGEFKDVKAYRNAYGDMVVSWGVSLKEKYSPTAEKCFTPAQFLYLLSKGFWLWSDDYFDDGLIIDAKTVTV